MERAIILAGGSGTRFWPLSRKSRPKQLIALYSEYTLLEETVRRAEAFADTVHVSINPELSAAVRAVLPDVPQIVEPTRRDTAAAIGFCAAQFADDDLLVFLPSDHYITPREEFTQTIGSAVEKARGGGIVVIGIEPAFPSTGYGYIRPGAGDAVEAFMEKPDAERAERFVSEGCLWNAGMFVATAGALLEEFREHAPDIHEHLLRIRAGQEAADVFPHIRKTSFDYAVMERSGRVRFVPATFRWNDLGSLPALAEIIEGDNVVRGTGALYDVDSHGNVVVSTKAVALVDCENMVVCETEDAILVCPKASAQRIKELQAHLPEALR